MQNIKKYKIIYVIICISIVLICIIICFIMDNHNNNKIDNYNIIEFTEENNKSEKTKRQGFIPDLGFRQSNPPECRQ